MNSKSADEILAFAKSNTMLVYYQLDPFEEFIFTCVGQSAEGSQHAFRAPICAEDRLLLSSDACLSDG